jgi:proliferating cell nuclear antigen
MVFKCLYPAATKFKYIVQTIVKILDEIPFTATPDGLEVRTLTPDKTTMIVLRMPTSSFEDYQLDVEEKTFIVSSDELNRVAKRGTRNDLVELALEEEQRRLRITFIDKKTSVTRTFYVPLREGVVEKLSEPQVELAVSVKMLAEDFKNIINDVKLVGDEAEFIGHEDRLEVRSVTPQREYVGVFEVGNPLISYDVSGSTPVRSKYAIDLLKASTKAATAADTVTVEFGESLPLRLSFDLPGGSVLIYWITPRS